MKRLVLALAALCLTACGGEASNPTANGMAANVDVEVIANATALTHAVNQVAAADDAKGVRLSGLSAQIVWSSQATNGLKVYPPVNSTINGGSANAAIVIEGLSMALCVPTNATNIAVQYTANT